MKAVFTAITLFLIAVLFLYIFLALLCCWRKNAKCDVNCYACQEKVKPDEFREHRIGCHERNKAFFEDLPRSKV